MASRSPEPTLRSARELLGVDADADRAQLARAYRRQARRLHPDINLASDATEQFWTLRAAYQLALDAVRRDVEPAEAPTPVAPHAALVDLGAAPRPRRPATPWPDRGSVAWLAAGPVHVQPTTRPDRPAPSSEERS